MSKSKSRQAAKETRKQFETGVSSLYEKMQDGNEYSSILSATLKPNVNLLDDLVVGLKEIARVRGRTCIAYVGNVVKQVGESGIDSTDDLPFAEMVAKVGAAEKKVDVFLATNGGYAQQVSRFVHCLRSRFEEVDFLIPSFCMSAGTIFALSGDRIWMTPRACLGPIDPQVPNKEGRYVPLQALLVLVKELQKTGEDAMKKGGNVPWSAVRIIDSLDKKDLASAITATQYSTEMATEFLKNFKLGKWTIRKTSQQPVTPDYRHLRATEIATALASHDRWKSHGHGISRDVLWQEVNLQIDHPDDKLNRAMVRLWAVFHWFFDKTSALKVMASSENYRYFRYVQAQEIMLTPAKQGSEV
ncbi:MAG: hypothetical protein HY289_14070 [Planctomycetes bacterium]|nr:hypothetical protein [Planctomycetota bacterium]